MCELFCLSSRNPTVASFSLRAFAQRGRNGIGPVDGWGLAFCDERDVRIYKEPEPAGDSEWLSFIQARRVPSRLVISHIRHATHGGICLANTQPFTRELGGRIHVFAHNGNLELNKLHKISKGQRFISIGDTDSEAAFCILLDRLSSLWLHEEVPTLASRLAVIEAFAAEMRELGPANFLYSDGDALFAHGHRRTQVSGQIEPPGLWWLQRQCACDRDALVASGVSLDHSPAPQKIVLLASVKLTDEPWKPLQEGEVMAIRNGDIVATAASSTMTTGSLHDGAFAL